MQVRDRMETDVLTVSPWDSCERALALMAAAGVETLLVVDESRFVGIVSHDGILARLTADAPQANPDGLLAHVRVAGVMTYAPETIGSGASLEAAAGALSRSGLDCVPVVDSGRLVGVLRGDGVSETAPFVSPNGHRAALS